MANAAPLYSVQVLSLISLCPPLPSSHHPTHTTVDNAEKHDTLSEVVTSNTLQVSSFFHPACTHNTALTPLPPSFHPTTNIKGLQRSCGVLIIWPAQQRWQQKGFW
ncbi:unnamed protein product, partial [Discosporangium mesarthrocarpum]